MPHMNVRDLGRVREISTVLVKHGFGAFVRRAGLEIEGEPIEVKLPFGRRLRRVLSDLGPTFVKFGQVLSVRPDIAPPDVIAELSELRDNVPPASFDAVRAVVEEDMGAPIETRFPAMDPEPIASASIAQVHRARLVDGTEVAVKIQRPGIEEVIRSDVHILYSIAQFVAGRIQIPGLYTPVGIVREFEAAIYQELDFLQEARAAARFGANFASLDDICAPYVYQDLCTRRVMVMEMVRGTRLSDLKDDGVRKLAAMDKLIEASYRQVFEHGFFHGDPHPGNLMVLDDGRLCYLDFGITGVLTGEMRDSIISLFLALVYKEPDSVALTLYRAGATEERVDLKAFSREIERMMAKYDGATLQDFSQSASLMEFVAVAGRFHIRLVPEYALLARATSILDGIARDLLPDIDIIERVRPYAQRLVGARLSSDRLTADALRLVQHAQTAVRDVPVQLNQLMLDLERGNLTLRTVDPEQERMLAEIRHAGIRLVMAMCTSALAVSGAILIAPWNPSPWGVPLQALFGVVVGSTGLALFFGLVIHTLFAARIHPRELRRTAGAVLRFFISRGGP